MVTFPSLLLPGKLEVESRADHEGRVHSQWSPNLLIPEYMKDRHIQIILQS